MTSVQTDPHAPRSSSADELQARSTVTDVAALHPASLDLRDVNAGAAHFGQHLRAAREARGETLDACAHALRLPLRVLRQLEADTYDGSDSRIYLASYITKYARHLGVDEAALQVELARMQKVQRVEPPLIATGGISRSRFLLDRYATAATYVVLTAVIVVPMIWLGVRGTLDRDLSHLAPLDAAPVAQQDARPALGTAAAARDTALIAAPRIAPPVVQDQPLLASMAPFPGLDNSTPAPSPAPAAESNGSGSHSVNLNLSAASWVEVIGQDGARMEYGLLPAGSNKTWHSDQPLDVRIGNASGAQLSIDGQAVALENFRRANVARLRVEIADGKAAAESL
jgi:cytoskeleton protein RodZ